MTAPLLSVCKKYYSSILLLFLICPGALPGNTQPGGMIHSLFPASGAMDVNPDTYLQINFTKTPILNNKGKILIYDAADNSLADELDLSVPPGPKNTRTPAPYDRFVYPGIPDSVYTVNKNDLDSTHIYQANYIGGNLAADKYHFYPVIIEGNTVKIFPHHHRLTYHKQYRIVIEKGVLSTAEGPAEAAIGNWIFSTRKSAPGKDSKNLIVSADGKGDFTTIQGAIDFIPENNSNAVSIFIRNGIYTEIINCRNRNKISITGEDRNGVIVRYANNGVFNFREMSPDPQRNAGIHNIRAIMAMYHVSEITLSNMTLQSVGEKPAQAEALLVIGDQIIVDNVSIEGSGDALQATGRVYVNKSRIQGYGDNVLGYGAVFFNDCDFVSTFGPHIWVRNTDKNHGNVLLNCTLRTIGDVETDIARAPDNKGIKYPYAEVVLIDCKVKGIRPNGWGKVTDSTEHIRYWEFQTTSLETGKPVDTKQRHPASRQLTKESDAPLIESYRNPAFVLEGWDPASKDK